MDFEDGLTFLEPHATIRKANKISPKATVQRVEMEDELKHGFFVHYDNGQTAEVSWAFVWELPPKNSKNKFLEAVPAATWFRPLTERTLIQLTPRNTRIDAKNFRLVREIRVIRGQKM